MAIDTIHKRSTGLLHFCRIVSESDRIPNPNYSIFPVKKLIENLKGLMKEELARQQIVCSCEVAPENLEVSVDEQLIEQVMINIKNSMQALIIQQLHIAIKAFADQTGRVNIQISDNGQANPPRSSR